MGYSQGAAMGGIRITLGRYTTQADVEWVAMVLKQVMSRLENRFAIAAN
jgi:cysteine desulfurase